MTWVPLSWELPADTVRTQARVSIVSRTGNGANRSGGVPSRMTDPTIADGADAPLDSSSLAWEVPEIAAVAILFAFLVIVVGGLATGFDVSASQQAPYFDPMENIWNAVQFGASWAEPLLAIVLLGVVGLCWWQVEAWSEEIEEASSEGFTALGHMQRARRISQWALGGLIVTAIGAVAGLAALIGFNIPSHPGQVVWSRVIGAGADTMATVVVVVAGIVTVNRLNRPHTDT